MSSLVEFLRLMRYKPERPQNRPPNKRMRVEPGRSVTVNEMEYCTSSANCRRTDALSFDISSIAADSTIECVGDGEASQHSHEMAVDHLHHPMVGVEEITIGNLTEGD